jgi:hypothetical protein
VGLAGLSDLVVEPMSARAPTQGGLWGDPLPNPVMPRGVISNDLDLFVAVVRLAIDPGYVVIGPTGRVLRRDPGHRNGDTEVEITPAYEDDMVAQLLGAGHLILGGHHYATRGRIGIPARTVLAPRATRYLISRWSHLHRPPKQRGERSP